MKLTTSILATAVAFGGMSMADDLPIVTMTMPSIEGSGNVEFKGSVIEAVSSFSCDHAVVRPRLTTVRLVDQGPSETTMVVDCEPKTISSASVDLDWCKMWTSATFVAGPSTYSMEAEIGGL